MAVRRYGFYLRDVFNKKRLNPYLHAATLFSFDDMKSSQSSEIK